MSRGVQEAIELLRAAVDAVAAVDVDGLGATATGQLLEALETESRRLDAATHHCVRRFDSRGDHTVLGYRSAAQWHRDRLGLSPATASRRVRTARQLSHLPTTAKRWQAGDISTDACRLVASARTEATADAFAQWEPWLADQAADFDHTRLTRIVRAWKARATIDDDTPPPDAERAAHVSTLLDGAVAIDATLGAIGGATFRGEFDRLVDTLHRADWNATRERLGRAPTVDELDRSPAQRRADALVEMATRSAAAAVSDTNRPRPLFTVVVSPDQLAHGLAELWDGQPLTAAQLARVLADDPDIERFVYGGPTAPIQHNPRRRFFTGRLRRAIQVRDRHCTGRGCDAPASRCDIDHIVPCSEGGPTTAANGRLACGPCNRARPNRLFTTDSDPP